MQCLEGDFQRKNDILHIHNLNLGKESIADAGRLPFGRNGFRIVNHCHDFAEDRPKNLAFLQSVIRDHFHENLQEVLYPPFENVQYIVLTSKDYDRLAGSGIRTERIHLLPNPVSPAHERIRRDREGNGQEAAGN